MALMAAVAMRENRLVIAEDDLDKVKVCKISQEVLENLSDDVRRLLMNVKRIAAFSLLSTLFLPSVSSAFAQESKPEDGYLEAEVVHVEVETGVMNDSVGPYGLRPATEEEMEASAARERKSIVTDDIIGTEKMKMDGTEPEVLMAYDTQVLASFTEGTIAKGDMPEVIMAYVPQESMPYSGLPEVPYGLLPATEEQVEKSRKSAKKPLAEEETGTIALATPTWTFLPGYVIYAQLTPYNCVPASVQAALRYLNGSAPEQSVIAEGCGGTIYGTGLSDALDYLNAMQSVNPYDSEFGADMSLMKNCLYTGITDYNAPSLIGLAFSAADGWLYTTPGHCVSVYGVLSDKTQFYLADPWIGYSGSGLSGYPWGYAKSATDIYNAYSSINGGLLW